MTHFIFDLGQEARDSYLNIQRILFMVKASVVLLRSSGSSWMLLIRDPTMLERAGSLAHQPLWRRGKDTGCTVRQHVRKIVARVFAVNKWWVLRMKWRCYRALHHGRVTLCSFLVHSHQLATAGVFCHTLGRERWCYLGILIQFRRLRI